jgi:RHS repeat-associated protein
VKDHLGNTRVVFTDENNDNTPEVLQVDNYYPFGMRHGQANTFSSGGKTTQYMYNGKELQEDFNLDWYDYGARMYDPSLSRFMTVDPLTEWHFNATPYHYCFNNPINLIDPFGMDTTYVAPPIPEVTVTAQRSSSISSSSRGGYWMVWNGVGQSQETEQNNSAKRMDISSFMPLFGVSSASRLFDFIRDALDIWYQIYSEINEPKETTDAEINAKNKTNNRGEEVDEDGQPKGKYSDWQRVGGDNGYSQFQDQTGDSLLFIDPYGDSTLMVPDRTGNGKHVVSTTEKK